VRLPAFELHRPSRLDELFELMAAHGPAARLMSGGTDLLPSLKRRKHACGHVVALKGIAELDGLDFDATRGLEIGANTILIDVARHAVVRERYPVLASAIDVLATPQVRHKATVAGNLCNASPCADTATPLMALGALAVLRSPSGTREVKVEDFIHGPGRTALAESEVLASVRVPVPPADLRTTYSKFSPRSRVDIAAVNLTLALRMREDVIEALDLFLGTVAPTPMRAARAEALLRGQTASVELCARAARAARGECRPITDVRASAEYKAELVEVLTRRALVALTGVA
jgi:carbon-monoxide dehydrogenase medium subunit